MPRTIVILIHGTFAPHALWCRSDSPLAQSLKALIPGDLECQPFNWTGRNRFRDRAQAAQELASALRALEQDASVDTVVLVAHSHGGNIALDALALAKTTKTRAITLSTPFLHVSMRQLLASHRLQLGLTGPFVALVCAAWLYLRSASWFAAMSVWSQALTATCTLTVMLVLAARAIRTANSFAEKQLAQLPARTLSSEKLLVMKTTADEAALALSLPVLLNVVVQKLYGPVEQLAAHLERLVGGVRQATFALLGALIGLLLFGAALMLLSQAGSAVPILLIIALGLRHFAGSMLKRDVPLVFSALGCLLLSTLSLPVTLAIILLALPFGREAILFGLALEVSAETCPIGAFPVVTIPSVTGRGLHHSLLYADVRTAKIIAHWLHKGRPPEYPNDLGT